MGCTTSTSAIQEQHNQGHHKRNIKSGFRKDLREQILEAIKNNNLSEFAVFSQQSNIPTNAQISQEGLFWMSSHFCCRFNAFKVLDYILKTAYVENPRGYIQYVNQQTTQGFTCLHLCSVWGSKQCLQILLKFGGLNLQIKDKTQATPYLTSINYKKNDIRLILKQYEDLNIAFLIVEHQRLAAGDLLAVQTNDTIKDKNQQKFVPKLNNGMKQAFGNLFLQTQQQKQIKAQKKRLQIQRQNIRAQLKRIQQEQARKYKQRVKKAQQQRKAKNQRQIQQKEEALLKQMAQKQQQLNKVKKNLNKINEEKQESILKQQIKKTQQFALKNQQKLNQKLTARKNMVQQMKQEVMKNKVQKKPEEPIPATQRNIKSETSGQLPTQLKQLYQQAKINGVFVDKSFPHTEASIGNTPKAKKFINDLAWLRPSQIFNGDYHLFDNIQPDDIKQGSLGVCYMLATLSTLAQYPQKIKSLFAFHDKSLGFYVIKILIHGQIKYIPVDDAIPCNKSTRSPLFAKPNGNQLWVCLVEKAWAKCIGNYMKAQSMTPNHLMQDLTTCPSFGAWFKDKTQKTKDIDFHIKSKNIVVLTSLPDKKIQGIVNNHAYSLLNVYEHQGKNIYKIRNPWGKFQWNGLYNQKSPFWTQQLKRKVNFVDADDGIFFLSEGQLLQAFVYYSISIIRLNNIYSYIPLQTKKDENKYFTFELQQTQQINLRFVQKFNRMLDDAAYKYSPVIFQVGKIQSSGQVTFLTEGDNSCFWGAKSVHADSQLLKKYQKGKYFIRIAVQWQNQSKYNTGALGIFASKKTTISELPKQQGQKYWHELMKSFALKKAQPTSKSNMQFVMTWMRGQMVCYSYAKQSQKQQNFQSKWTFQPSKFVNCAFPIGLQGVDLKYKIGKGPKNAGVGYLRRLVINQSCNSGNVYISASPVV